VGTTFTIHLPVAARLLASAGGAPVAPMSRRAKVLVVDDEPAVRAAVRDLLTRDGHAVTVCPDGETALARLDADEFDLVITDLGMAGLSGWDVARLVKVRAPALPVAMITGWSDRIDLEHARANGVEHVISKPFRRDDLRHLMYAILSEGRALASRKPAD
jgi:CheY-like chemotaxis protein